MIRITTQKEISDEQKKFLTEVLTYYQEFAGEKADDEASRARTALAAGRVATIESRLGRRDESAAACRLALDGYATLAAEFPRRAEVPQGTSAKNATWVICCSTWEKRPEAEEQYRKALAIREKLVAGAPRRALYRTRPAPPATTAWGFC